MSNTKSNFRFRRLPSMNAWLNDYRPKKGKYIKNNLMGIYGALKPHKGKYKPKCH